MIFISIFSFVCLIHLLATYAVCHTNFETNTIKNDTDEKTK